MRTVVFVAPYYAATTLRFLRCCAEQPHVRLGLVSHEPLDRLPRELARKIAQHWQIGDALDPDQLAGAVEEVSSRIGRADRLLGVLEQLQVPLAVVRQRLGIAGMGVEVARNFRDKARMKTLLRGAGIPCARHRLATRADEVRKLAREAGFPLVLKPPAGAGARATFRVDDAAALEQALAAAPPTPREPVLAEEFVTGKEHSFETVSLDGRPLWHSLSHYLPSPLEVLRHPWIQWCVLLPRSIDEPRFDAVRALGRRVLEVLGMDTGLTHMEWFERDDGSLAISEVAARPPGAQITSLTSWAHEFDLYAAWARLMIHGEFDPPDRRFAAGGAFLRGQGGRRVVAVHGLDEAQREIGGLVVEARLPQPGQPAGDTYEGEGYVLLRHPETRVVERALHRLITAVRVELA